MCILRLRVIKNGEEKEKEMTSDTFVATINFSDSYKNIGKNRLYTCR